jgi:putative ABC transport system ATP-binding protein
LLEIRDLEHRFRRGAAPVLAIEHFALAAKSELCLVGGSGTGKTTFLNVVAGLIAPHRGAVRHGETDITRLGEVARDRFRARHIGYVFQTFNLLPTLTVLENLLVPLGLAGVKGEEARRRGIEALSRLRIGHLLDARPARLSVGERQRVAIARAIVNRPALVLADEPTANLDEDNADRALELLREMVAESEASLLLVTHARRLREKFAAVEDLGQLNGAAR